MTELEKDRRFLYQAVFTRILERIEKKCQEPEGFQWDSIGLIDPEDRIRCILRVRRSSADDGTVLAEMGSLVPGSDMLISHYVHEDNLENMKKWLAGPESMECALKNYPELLKNAKEKKQ